MKKLITLLGLITLTISPSIYAEDNATGTQANKPTAPTEGDGTLSSNSDSVLLLAAGGALAAAIIADSSASTTNTN